MAGFFQGPDSEELVAQLLDLVSQDYSFARIAQIMGAPSRNVVLCKFNRMRDKDPTLSHPSGNDSGARRDKPRAPRPIVLKEHTHKERGPAGTFIPADTAIAPLEINGAKITDVGKNMCSYPLGDPGDANFHYCGHPRREKSPYCVGHHAKCFQPRVAYKRKVDHAGRQR